VRWLPRWYQQSRMRDRIAPFEEALREIDPERRQQALSSLAKEQAAQLPFWTAALLKQGRVVRYSRAADSYVGEIVIIIVLSATIALMVRHVFFVLVVIGIAVAGVCIYGRRLNMRRRLLDSLRQRLCPTCQYDLSKIENLSGGGKIGPRMCPECGAAWPLVLPLS